MTDIETNDAADIGGTIAQTPEMEAVVVKLASGSRVNIEGYEIHQELGRGGMGIVYRALHRKLNRVVALKIVLSGVHAGPGEREKFQQEAEAMAKIRHPSIVAVHDIGEADGVPFLAMEFCPGGSLAQRIRSQPQEPHFAALMTERLARGVAEVHRHNILHRDLKPANVLLDADGLPRITDFGLARVWQPGADGDGGMPTMTLAGTPSYMAPEQIAGGVKTVGPRTDIYALGAILYEMLTALPPHSGQTVTEVLARVAQEEVIAPRVLQPRTPRDLETICLKCLHREAAKRYATADELADDLRRWQEGRPILARPVGPVEKAVRWTRRNPSAAFLLASTFVLLVTVAVGSSVAAINIAQSRRERDIQAGKVVEELARVKDLTAQTRRDQLRQSVLIGTRLWDEGNRYGALMWFARGQTQDSEDPLNRLRVATAAARAPLEYMWFDIRHLSFSPVAPLVLIGRSDGTTQVQKIPSGELVGPAVKHAGRVLSTGFSPDGSRVVVVASPTATQPGEVHLREVADGKLIHKWTPVRPVRHASFSPDGSEVVLIGTDDGIAVRRCSDGALVPRAFPARATGAVVSDSGGRLACLAGGRLRLVDATTGGEVAGWPEVPNASRLRLSADGGTVVGHVRNSSEPDRGLVWRQGSPGPLSVPIPEIRSSAVDPKGGRVAFGGADGTVSVCDGDSDKPTLRLPHGGAVRQMAFSRDGARLMVVVGPPEAVGEEPAKDPRELRLREIPDRFLVWDLKTATVLMDVGPIPDHELVTADGEAPFDEPMGFDATGRWVMYSSGSALEGESSLWDMEDSLARMKLLPDSADVTRARFRPDGKTVFADAGAWRVWDTVTGSPVVPLPREPETTRERLRELVGVPRTEVLTVRGPDGRERSLPQSRTEFVVEEKVISTRSGFGLDRLDATKLQMPDQTRVLALNPSQDRVFTVTRFGEDDSRKEYRVRSLDGTTLSPPIRVPTSGVCRVACFSADSQRIAAEVNGVLRVYNFNTGLALSEPFDHRPNQIAHMEFSPTGSDLLVTVRPTQPSVSGSVWKYLPVETLDLSPAALERKIRLLSQQRADTAGNLRPATPDEVREDWEEYRKLRSEGAK